MTTQAQQPAMGEKHDEFCICSACVGDFNRAQIARHRASANPESVGDDVVSRFRFVATHAREDLPLNMSVPAARALLARIEADAATIATLQAEKEQLREALRLAVEVLEFVNGSDGTLTDEHWDSLGVVLHNVAALTAEPK